MKQTMRFSRRISEVSDSFDVSVPYFLNKDNQKRFGNKTQDLDFVTNKKELFDTNRKKYIDRRQCTSFVTEDNNLYIGQIKEGLNILVADVPNSTFTADDKRILNIVEKGKGHRIIIVTFGAQIAIVHVDYLQITVEILNPTTPNSTAMPKGHILFFETFIGEPNIADTEIVFGNGVYVSTAKHIIQFKASEIGKTCYMRGSYENKHHERGPVSIIISKVIA